MSRRITVIIRPPLDRSELDPLRAAIESLRAEGHRVRVRLTWEPGDARRWARSAARGGCDVVVAAGGDGTVNEVVNGLVSSAHRVRRSGGGRDLRSDSIAIPALAVVPLGTANDFARGIGLPGDPVECLFIAAYGRTVPLDVARVNRRCFVNVSTGGFAAEATREASPLVKRLAGGLAYILRGGHFLWSYERARMSVRADDRDVFDGDFAFFTVANAHLTGGGTPIAPAAQPHDGLLDLTIITGVSRLELIRLMPVIRRGRHIEDPRVRYVRARRIQITSPDDLAVNADGEVVAGRDFRYDVLPRELRVMVPEEESGPPP